MLREHHAVFVGGVARVDVASATHRIGNHPCKEYAHELNNVLCLCTSICAHPVRTSLASLSSAQLLPAQGPLPRARSSAHKLPSAEPGLSARGCWFGASILIISFCLRRDALALERLRRVAAARVSSR